MAITTPVTYQEMYMGSMSERQANLVLEVRQSKVIENLRGMIFDFPVELVMQSTEEFRSIRSILKDRNEDAKKYIGSLRDYQTLGTAFMYLSPRSILADGVGLGKTAEISALINFLVFKKEMSRFCIAVETSAIAQTQYELMRFTGLNVVSLPSEARNIRKVINNIDWTKVDGIVIKHSTLRSDVFSKWLSINLDSKGMCNLFNVFFLDESSVVKNPDAKVSQYTRNICNIVPRVHFMNATTFETKLMDVYYQSDMLNDQLLPKKWRIEQEYCTFGRRKYWTKENGKPKLNWKHELNGYKNQAKFKESLKLFYFGRCKADVGMDMPHIYKVYEVEPSADQIMALNMGYRYMEVLNCPSLVTDMGIETSRKTVPKLNRLCELMENEFSQSSVMIYCFHLDSQESVRKEMEALGRKPIVLNGDCTDEARYEAQQGFNNGKYDVIITNIKKSLNLYGGDVCIFYNAITNPAGLFQAAGRIDRNVDDKIKTFVLMLYKNTDEYNFFMNTVKQRAKDARDLTIDAKTTVDFFIDSMTEEQ